MVYAGADDYGTLSIVVISMTDQVLLVYNQLRQGHTSSQLSFSRNDGVLYNLAIPVYDRV